MTNNTSGINIETKVNGWKLEIVISFKHLGSFTVDEGFKPEILSRIAKMTVREVSVRSRSVMELNHSSSGLPSHHFRQITVREVFRLFSVDFGATSQSGMFSVASFSVLESNHSLGGSLRCFPSLHIQFEGFLSHYIRG